MGLCACEEDDDALCHKKFPINMQIWVEGGEGGKEGGNPSQKSFLARAQQRQPYKTYYTVVYEKEEILVEGPPFNT